MTTKLGNATVWLSAVSALAYFLLSNGVKNHLVFLFETVRKAVFR